MPPRRTQRKFEIQKHNTLKRYTKYLLGYSLRSSNQFKPLAFIVPAYFLVGSVKCLAAFKLSPKYFH